MRVLTLNPGSASMKAALVVDGAAVAADSWAVADTVGDEHAIRDVLRRWERPDGVAVRFVHGGSRAGPQLLDESLLQGLSSLTPLAPLHQPLSLDAARLVHEALPEVPAVACFDTAFHRRLPEAAARYALPRTWTRQDRLRRYGFHGLSCRYALRRAAGLLDQEEAELRMVCCHIGSGVSVTALRGGASTDTSMGFTPMEGAVMATRSGSVDPGLLLHVLAAGEIDVATMIEVLQRRSGLAGMTGTSGDFREVLAARAAGDLDAALAVDVFAHRLRREIGAVAMSLDRLDAVVFTGGVAEHQPALLGEFLDGMGLLGLSADADRLGGEGDRSVNPTHEVVAVLVIRAREDLELAREAEEVLMRPQDEGGRGSSP